MPVTLQNHRTSNAKLFSVAGTKQKLHTAASFQKTQKANVKVIQYGIETDFKLETGSISILEAAIEAGVDAPFSCKGAVCCTCRAKVLEGKVRMDANFALTDAEVAEGFILTCQSHPLTETVVVDYDA